MNGRVCLWFFVSPVCGPAYDYAGALLFQVALLPALHLFSPTLCLPYFSEKREMPHFPESLCPSEMINVSAWSQHLVLLLPCFLWMNTLLIGLLRKCPRRLYTEENNWAHSPWGKWWNRQSSGSASFLPACAFIQQGSPGTASRPLICCLAYGQPVPGAIWPCACNPSCLFSSGGHHSRPLPS